MSQAQRASRWADQATSERAFGKEVTLQTHGRSKYGRTIADVVLRDGTDVNHTLVKEGRYWWYWKYALGDPEECTHKDILPMNAAELFGRLNQSNSRVWR